MDALEALAPLHRICQLCNLWPWRLNESTRQLQRCRWLELYGWLVLLGSSVFLAYGLFNADHLMREDSSVTGNIGHTVDYIQLVGIRVAHVMALLEALWQRRAQSSFFTQLQELDREFARLLHIEVNNEQLRRRMTQRAAWMLAGYVLSQGFILITKMLGTDHTFPMYWLAYLLPLLVCGVRYFQIFTAVLLVRQRLDLLLRLLQSLQLNETLPGGEHSCDCKYIVQQLDRDALAAQQRSLQRLMAARQLYQRLWLLVSLLNRCFGLSMLMNLGNDFLAITSNCYWIFLNFRQFAASPQDFLQIIGSAVWSTPHVGNVLALALICERAAYCVSIEV
ncbi:putative gustatory receptor 2a [Drosophila busckii]|uniref:putative gustatory receptor 2a n=1 Tax=Drosophila busckii TaxID=30019 RepID=UPI00083E9AB8|nr:putative gustatory receptor 2a [Drosophila busckii]